MSHSGSNEHDGEINPSHASDDVEESTRNMDAAFGSSHLVPKQALRVTNPEEEEEFMV